MRSPGGTPGGGGLFLIGLGLVALATYLFFWGVVVRTDHPGLFSGFARGRGQGGMFETTAMAILFVPFLIGTIALFYDATKKWAWGLVYLGIAILAIEVLSRIRFEMSMRLAHLLGLMVLFAAGAGLMLRSYRDLTSTLEQAEESKGG
ncbi:MAG: hypothetical protein AAF483_31115 [Planctomycetota bacterium]